MVMAIKMVKKAMHAIIGDGDYGSWPFGRKVLGLGSLNFGCCLNTNFA